MAADIRAYIATHRFGLGPRSGDMAAIAEDPAGWLRQQLNSPPQIPPALAQLPNRHQRMTELIAALKARKAQKDAAQPNNTAPNNNIANLLKTGLRAYRDEASHRLRAAIDTDTPFVERLVHFWSNHFTVSVTKNEIRGLVGTFEREAIRPYVLGRFEDMLIASTTHPAMLQYLDQTTSIGPHSLVGTLGQRGLNENLAREILELHTLGVDGGYSQADVTSFAHILTGWTISGIRALAPAKIRKALDQNNTQQGNDDNMPGAFLFAPYLHEPGPKQFMGYEVAENGVEEGMRVLRFLAKHPATARFIATKMARHFIADDPPESAINTLSRVFLQSGGNLRQMAACLIEMPECWANPLAKVKTPTEYMVAIVRATGVNISDQELFKQIETLGQMPFSAPSPAGWPDRAESWIGAESLLRRISFAQEIAARIARTHDPRALLADVIGAGADQQTQLWISRAPDAIDGIAMVLAASAFQRR